MTKNNFDIKTGLHSQLPHIKSCCRKFLSDPDEVELLYSEVIEKIWTNRLSFNGTEAMFKAWSFTIARNTFISHYNKNKAHPHDDIEPMMYQINIDDGFSIEGDIDNKKLLKDTLSKIKEKFSGRDYKVFDLVCIQGFKYHEAADKVGIPIGSVKNIIFRVRDYIINPEKYKPQPAAASKPAQPAIPLDQKPMIRPRTKVFLKLIRLKRAYAK